MLSLAHLVKLICIYNDISHFYNIFISSLDSKYHNWVRKSPTQSLQSCNLLTRWPCWWEKDLFYDFDFVLLHHVVYMVPYHLTVLNNSANISNFRSVKINFNHEMGGFHFTRWVDLRDICPFTRQYLWDHTLPPQI